jgi:hypothetical protein
MRQGRAAGSEKGLWQGWSYFGVIAKKVCAWVVVTVRVSGRKIAFVVVLWAVVEKDVEEVRFRDFELFARPNIESTEEVFACPEGEDELVTVESPPAEGYIAVEPCLSYAVPVAGNASALKEVPW